MSDFEMRIFGWVLRIAFYGSLVVFLWELGRHSVNWF